MRDRVQSWALCAARGVLAEYPRAQASVPISSSAKSYSVGRAYAAAMADVLKHGSLPVPNHLGTAGDRRMKAHGIGVWWRETGFET